MSMQLLRQGSQDLLGLAITDAELAGFERYYAELTDWNSRVNLTTITDCSEIQVKHFLDSLTCLLALRDLTLEGECPDAQKHGETTSPAAGTSGPRVIDIGSGGGFPGLPLKMVCSNWRLTLLEAVLKKAEFLEHLTGLLGLRDVRTIHARAEDLGQDPAHRELYDLALARAVADLPLLVEYALPLVRVGGAFVAQKGRDVDQELSRAAAAIRLLGGEADRIVGVQLPGLDEPRNLVRVRKVSPTPAKYPRRAGMPKKRPLG